VSSALVAQAVIIAAVAGAAFSFGAVYPWGYWPLAAVATALGLFGLVFRRSEAPARFPALALSLTVFVSAAAFQLLPLPSGIVARISPEAPDVSAQYRPGLRAAASQPLSISPSDTARGVVLAASFAVFVIGVSRLLAYSGTIRLCFGIAIVGVLLAITGMAQQAMYNGKILGFWTSLHGGTPYGPFVNRNHFAGWLLMAIPLSIGLFFALISRQARTVGPAVRERLLWLSTPDASQAILLGAGIAVMALSIVLSMSRSGISTAVCAIGIAAVLAWRRNPAAQRKVVIAVLLVIVVGAVAWVGVDRVIARFAESGTGGFSGRTGPWADAWRIARRFPVAGTGLNTYGVATLFYQQFNPTVHYSAAHNDYLQLVAEGGALLTIPAAACLVLLIAAILRRFREESSKSTYWIRAGAVIGIVAIGIQEIVDFSLQIPANALLFSVLCAIAIHQTPERRYR
jgi:O-antigen ligase